MRLSVSNLAWDPAENEVIAAMLQQEGVDAIDVAPSKIVRDVLKADSQEALAVAAWWRARGIHIVGLQSLLYGTQDLNLFGDDTARARMLQHLEHVCRLGHHLGARALTFGSPKQRDCAGLSHHQTQDIATRFFRQLGDIAAQHSVDICVEPAAACYGGNFLMTHAQASDFVRHVGHPHIKLQMDTGAMAIAEEVPEAILARNHDIVGHVHLSEPALVPFGDGAAAHVTVAAALHAYRPADIVTIEMLPTRSESHVLSVKRAIGAAKQAIAAGSPP